jgi:hypothetical protein
MLLAMASANVVSTTKINLFSCEASTSRSLKNQQLAISTQQLAALILTWQSCQIADHGWLNADR